MGLQKFYADPRTRREESNGAVSYAPGGMAGEDCLGHFAKIENCPIHGTAYRRTCYATGYADTYFSIPAACQINGRTVRGYLTSEDGAPIFRPYYGQIARAEHKIPREWRELYAAGSGRLIAIVPPEAIDDMPHSGPADEHVDYYVPRVHWIATREDLARELSEYGAWDDLDTAPLETLQARALWTLGSDARDRAEEER